MKNLLILCLFSVTSIGCARKAIESKELAYVQVGMDKAQVRSILGRPSIVRSSCRNKEGKLIEVHEYKVNRTSLWRSILGEEDLYEHYWLQFEDGKLAKWERGTDPLQDADKVVEVRTRKV